MDKKELNDLIDRVVLTGPGGVDKIKKILKELVNDGGSGSGSGSGSSSSSPMIVEGVIYPSQDEGDESVYYFIPNDGQPTLEEAISHMKSGGIVYFCEDDGISQITYISANIIREYEGGRNSIGGVIVPILVIWDSEVQTPPSPIVDDNPGGHA